MGLIAGAFSIPPPSINTALPNRRLNFVILFVSFVTADPVLFFFFWGGGLKVKPIFCRLKWSTIKLKIYL
jgi:hypothetical protein